MIRIGALALTDDMGSLYRDKEHRLEHWLGICCNYVNQYKTLVPEGRLAEIEDLLCNVPGWEEKM